MLRLNAFQDAASYGRSRSNRPGVLRISQPFVAGVGGYKEYRIPSLVALPNSGLLAFAEGRKLSCSDVDWNDIVSRRSTDGGATWEPMVLVHGESTSKRHVCIGNPSPVVVASKPGRVVLCGTRQLQEGFSVTSEDYGKTWGKAVYQPALVAKKQRGSGAPPPVHGQAASNWTCALPSAAVCAAPLAAVLTRRSQVLYAGAGGGLPAAGRAPHRRRLPRVLRQLLVAWAL